MITTRQVSRRPCLQRRAPRALGAAVLSLALGVLATALVGSPAQAAGGATSSASVAIPVDRQGYAVDTPADPYQGDASSTHVALDAGREQARAFAHVALDYLPLGATAVGGTLTLHLTTQSGAANTSVYQVYNVNTSSAVVAACVLKADLPATIDATTAPAYDCSKGTTSGKQSSDGQTWTFDLAPLLRAWKRTGDNTGLALVPVAAGPADTWSVSFYVSQATSSITYTVPDQPAPTPAPSTPQVPPAVSSGAAGGLLGGVVAPPVGTPPTLSPTTPAEAPTVAAPAATTAAAPATVASRRAGMQSWPLVLLLCVAVALGCFGLAARGDTLAVLGRLVAGARAAWRASPQLGTLGVVALAWGLLFSGYSVYVGPTVTTTTTQQAVGSTNTGPTEAAGPSSSPGSVPGRAVVPTGAPATRAPGAGSGPAQQQPQAVSANPVTSEFSGAGTYRTISGTKVFFPADGSTPVANLYTGADDVIGITSSQINLCTHAALTYGSAFNISASDLGVYWTKLNEHGGIFGRKVNPTYQNDNYDPGTAVKAAQACKDAGTFVLSSGVGFDQIPSVRAWAEQNHELYLYGNAVEGGSQGLRYSFTAATSVEQMGAAYGNLVVSRFPGKKVGILYRSSPNWTPGSDAFKQVVESAGMKVVASVPVTLNQGSYISELTTLRQAGADVVLAWENELSDVEIVKQAQGQQYFPAWALPPGNLELNTLGSASLQQPLVGIGLYDPYDPGYYGGKFASYASDIHQFEADYAKYDSGANLKGDGGDLLFSAWESEKLFAAMLTQCGRSCTRNRLAGMLLAGYHQPVSPNCAIDFGRDDHHHAGYLQNAEEAWTDPNGQIAWNLTERCVARP